MACGNHDFIVGDRASFSPRLVGMMGHGDGVTRRAMRKSDLKVMYIKIYYTIFYTALGFGVNVPRTRHFFFTT